jgi:hypothetical protein
LALRAILDSTVSAVDVEDYPNAFKRPTVLALHIHVVWGLTKAAPDMATLVTAYVPDPQKWYDGFMQRRPKSTIH